MRLLFCALMMVITAASTAQAKERNYCQEEAKTWLKQRFGEQAEALSFKKSGGTSRGEFGWSNWMRTNVCKGYFVFKYGSYKPSACTIVRYNSPQMTSLVWANGECKQHLPRQEYPRGLNP